MMPISKLILALIAFNQLLLLFYFTYSLTDTDIDLQQTKQTLLRKIFKHEQQTIDKQEQDIIIPNSDYDESTYDEYSDESQPNLDVLYNDKSDRLATIGEDDSDSNQRYLQAALRHLNPLSPAILDNQIVRSQSQLSLAKNPNYCNLNDLYFLMNNNITQEIVTDYEVDSIITKAILTVGNDVLPSIPVNTNKRFYIPLVASLYFMENESFYKYFKVGSEAICSLQMFNHIIGSEVLKRKDKLTSILRAANIIHPLTYIMTNKTECEDYFKQTNLNDSTMLLKNHHDRPLKINTVIQDRLQRKFRNTTLCGLIVDDIVIQQAISIKSRLFAIVDLVQGESQKLTIHDGLTYEFTNGKYENHQPYDQQIKKQISTIVHTLFKEANPYFMKDDRFFEVFRIEFLLDKEGHLHLISINNKIEKDPTIYQHTSNILEKILVRVNQLQNEKSLKFRQKYMSF